MVEDAARRGPEHLTVDEFAAAAGTTTRHVRSLQTLGLVPHPELHGRTGVYSPDHRARLAAVLALQEQGFSLESLRILFEAHAAGRSLAAVLGQGDDDPSAVVRPPQRDVVAEDAAALYGFAELQPPAAGPPLGAGRPLLSVIPTTVWDEDQAS